MTSTLANAFNLPPKLTDAFDGPFDDDELMIRLPQSVVVRALDAFVIQYGAILAEVARRAYVDGRNNGPPDETVDATADEWGDHVLYLLQKIVEKNLPPTENDDA